MTQKLSYITNKIIPRIIRPKLNIIPNGIPIFLVMIDAFSTPKSFLNSHAFGLVSIYFFANAGFIRDLTEKNKPRIPIPSKSKE